MAQPIGPDAVVVAAGRAYGPRAFQVGDACIEATARAARDTAAFGFAETDGEAVVIAAHAPPGALEDWHAEAIADAMIAARAAP
jgi:hypothetical protein